MRIASNFAVNTNMAGSAARFGADEPVAKTVETMVPVAVKVEKRPKPGFLNRTTTPFIALGVGAAVASAVFLPLWAIGAAATTGFSEVFNLGATHHVDVPLGVESSFSGSVEGPAVKGVDNNTATIDTTSQLAAGTLTIPVLTPMAAKVTAGVAAAKSVLVGAYAGMRSRISLLGRKHTKTPN